MPTFTLHTAGELGTEPRVLERSLRETLELAKTWDAVLLLDEADVVLEARSQHEIQRNGLVSGKLARSAQGRKANTDPAQYFCVYLSTTKAF